MRENSLIPITDSETPSVANHTVVVTLHSLRAAPPSVKLRFAAIAVR